MKVIEQSLTGFVTLTLPVDEADLLYRATDGYVALARTLTDEVSCRFPEGKEEVSRKLNAIHCALHAAVERHKAATRVWSGQAEAIDKRDLEWLREQAKRMAEIDKTTPKEKP